jgi:serine protease
MVNAGLVDASKVSNRKVCIIDTGYNFGHPDLQIINVSGTSHDTPPWDQDGHGHGTHVAGTIAALGNNNVGVVGIVPNGMMSLHIARALKNNGRGRLSSVIAAMYSCRNVGSNIISMSLGGSTPSAAIKKACDDIYDEGTLIIAAAGNAGNGAYAYPASYDSVMSVAAVDSNKQRASFSQYNDQVDISAPGVGVRSTIPGPSYASFSGTSSKFLLRYGILI